MLNRLLLFLALLVPQPTAAQDPIAVEAAEEEEGWTICVAIGHRWIGDNADIRDIERVPVPESYRRDFEAKDSCVNFQLIKESLIDWHLRFGSQRSVVLALDYLERAYTHEVPTPERYLEELERAWRDAEGDLRRAIAIQQREGVDYSPRQRFIRGSRTIQQLSGLGDGAHGNYQFLAAQYLRAAEEHGSLALLEKSERYIRVVRSGGELLDSFETREPLGGLVTYDFDKYRSDDMEMRAAVLRARLTRTKDAIDRAEAVMRSKEQPHYRRLAELAFSGGDDFCDIDGGERQAEALEAACEAEDELHEQVVNYMLGRAMLDLVGGVDPSDWGSSYAVTLRLLQAEKLYEETRCCGSRSADEEMLRLQLARAEHHQRLFQTLGTQHRDYASELQEALDQFRAAELLARPSDAPARFQRIAHAWLDGQRRWKALREEREWGQAPADARYAAYLERTLADLDAIAQGIE